MLEALLVLLRRIGCDGEYMLATKCNLANCLHDAGRLDEALVLERELYAGRVAVCGVSDERSISIGSNLANTLTHKGFWNECISLLRDQLLPAARQSLGPDHDLMLKLNYNLGMSLGDNPESTRDDLLDAEAIIQGVIQRRRRVFGPAHPGTRSAEGMLSGVRARLERA